MYVLGVHISIHMHRKPYVEIQGHLGRIVKASSLRKWPSSSMLQFFRSASTNLWSSLQTRMLLWSMQPMHSSTSAQTRRCPTRASCRRPRFEAWLSGRATSATSRPNRLPGSGICSGTGVRSSMTLSWSRIDPPTLGKCRKAWAVPSAVLVIKRLVCYCATTTAQSAKRSVFGANCHSTSLPTTTDSLNVIYRRLLCCW